jgi:hypothetical protein
MKKLTTMLIALSLVLAITACAERDILPAESGQISTDITETTQETTATQKSENAELPLLSFREGIIGNGIDNYLDLPLILTESDVIKATVDFDEHLGFIINIAFSRHGATVFYEVTTRLSEQRGVISIWLGDECISAPTVHMPIVDGRAQISGLFDRDTAMRLAEILNIGDLPPIDEVYDYKSCEFFNPLLVAELEQLSETIREMILNGDDLDTTRTYMVDLYNSTQARVFYGFFDVFDGKETSSFRDSTSLELGIEYDDMLEAMIEHGTVFPCPTESEWYKSAVAANGEVAMTAPYGYVLARSHEKDHVRYTQAIFDDNGDRIAIICMEVWLNGIEEEFSQ